MTIANALNIDSNTITGTGSIVLSDSPSLVSPGISSIVNSGTLTLPTSTDTLIGRDTVDTLTNKSMDGLSNTFVNISLTSSVSDILPSANGGTGTGDTPANSNLLVGNSSGQFDVATVFGNNGITVGYFEPLKQFSIDFDGSQTTDVLPQGYINGLNLSFVSSTEIGLEQGSCKDSNNLINIFTQAGNIGDTTVSGINGLDTGTIAANTHYFVHSIGDSTQVNPGRILFSLSSSSPTLPSPYDIFRLIGEFDTDGSSGIIANSIHMVIVTLSANNIFSGALVSFNTTLSTSSESSFSATTTLASSDLTTKKILNCNAVGNIVLTLPSASSIDSDLGKPSVNQTLMGIMVVNVSVGGSVTIAAGTGTSISGMANPVILPSSNRILWLRKSAGTPSYIVYG